MDFAWVCTGLESEPAPPHVLLVQESPKMLSIFAVNPGKKRFPQEGAPMFVQDGLGSKELLSDRRHGSNCSVFVLESAYHGDKKKKKRARPRSHSLFPGAPRWAARHKCTPRSMAQRKGLSPRLMLAASCRAVCLAQSQREQIWSMGLAGYCKSWDQSCFPAGV